MSHNNYRYYLCKTDDTSRAEIESKGGYIANCSTDGTLCMVDNQNGPEIVLSDPPSLPSYVVEVIADPQNMSHEEAKAVISYQATTQGASDGWWYSTKGEV